MQTKSKTSLFVEWPQDKAHCVIGVQDNSSGLSVMLNPLEVEALILHLCQSPWRMVDVICDNVTRH